MLFPNPQSMFNGLQVGFVNIGTGNLTFRRRDLVVSGREQLRFSRVYDSGLKGGYDFGPGWRLALVSELRESADGNLDYINGAGARYEFRRTAHGTYVGGTPAHDGDRIVVRGDGAVWIEGGDLMRVYQRLEAGGPFLIVSRLYDSGAYFRYEYEKGRLARIRDENGNVVHIGRDAQARVVSVIDRGGRTVRYEYDAHGRLARTRDVAGHWWRYGYGVRGFLTDVTGPNGEAVLRVRYGAEGRVSESRTGQTRSFRYTPDQTTVVAAGQEHVLTHDANGATIGYESSGGVAWRVRYDQNYRVQSLVGADSEHSFEYTGNGRPSRVVEVSADGTRETEFEYDGGGRLVALSSSGGENDRAVEYGPGSVVVRTQDGQWGFGYLSGGEIGYVTAADGALVRAEYDETGVLVGIHGSSRSVQFERGTNGRVVSTRYADGTVNRYRYDGLGNRLAVSYGTGGAVQYDYDPTGNIRRVAVRNPHGGSRRKTVHVGDYNRIERINYLGSGYVDIEYRASGAPAAFDFGFERVELQYDDRGALQSYSVKTTGEIQTMGLDAAGAHGDRVAFSSSLAVLARDVHGPLQPHHGMLTFADATFEPDVADPMELYVPRLRDARQLLQVASSLLQDEASAAMQQFEKPSNPVFQSMEYRSVNCCIPCIGYCGQNYCQPNKPMKVCRAVSSFNGFASCNAGIEQVVNPRADTNGCSTPANAPLPFRQLFTPSCDVHDVCYNTCENGQGSCDTEFRDNMESACLGYHYAHRNDCFVWSTKYYLAVSRFGRSNYESAQVRHCHCCEWE